MDRGAGNVDLLISRVQSDLALLAGGSGLPQEYVVKLTTHYYIILRDLKNYKHNLEVGGHGAFRDVKFNKDGSLIRSWGERGLFSHEPRGTVDAVAGKEGGALGGYGRLTSQVHTPQHIPAIAVQRMTGQALPQWSMPKHNYSQPKWT